MYYDQFQEFKTKIVEVMQMNKESSKPLITTIIPTYRRPKLLQLAIRSVLNQTYPHLQVCVCDNASGDETSAVVAEIAREDTRVKYHCQSRNIGAVANFNYGMKQVTTPFFSLLADDNTLLPHFFEDAITTLNSYPETILFVGQTIKQNEKGQNVGGSLDLWESGLIHPPDGLLHIIEKGLPDWESILFRREVINSVGLLNPSFGGSLDQDFLMRIARKHTLYISKKPHALFLYHYNSWGSSRDLSEVVSTRRKLLEQWIQDEELSEDMKRRIMETWKVYLKEIISNTVFCKCIIGEDASTIDFATELMKKELGLSYKPIRAILLAKMANHNRFLKRLVLSSVCLYMQLKIKYISLKNRKKWRCLK